MAKRGKKYQEALKLVDRFNKYSIDEAVELYIYDKINNI